MKLHRKRALPLQQGHGALHGLQRVAWVDGIDQVRDEFAVTVGLKGVPAFLQLSAQGMMVVHMALVQNSDPGQRARVAFGAMAELHARRIQRHEMWERGQGALKCHGDRQVHGVAP